MSYIVDGLRVRHVAKVFRLLADLLDDHLVVFVVVEIGLERDNVVDEGKKHVDDHGKQKLVHVRIDHARVDELNEEPRPVGEIVRVFLFI